MPAPGTSRRDSGTGTWSCRTSCLRQTRGASMCSWRTSHKRSAARSNCRVRVSRSRLGPRETPAVLAMPLSRRRARRTVAFFSFCPIVSGSYAGVRIFGSIGRGPVSRPGWTGPDPSLSAAISSLVLPSSRTNRAASRRSSRARSNNGPTDILTRFATPFCPSARTII